MCESGSLIVKRGESGSDFGLVPVAEERSLVHGGGSIGLTGVLVELSEVCGHDGV